MDTNKQATTLRELLSEMQNGYSLFSPILIHVHESEMYDAECTTEQTMTSRVELDWAEEYTREYGDQEYLVVGNNSLAQGLTQKVSIGRSRKCDVRIENDSVSKTHASIAFDRGMGGYVLTDEASRNGTCINGEPLKSGVPTSLWPGAYVSFGDSVFVFVDPPTLRKLAKVATKVRS